MISQLAACSACACAIVATGDVYPPLSEDRFESLVETVGVPAAAINTVRSFFVTYTVDWETMKELEPILMRWSTSLMPLSIDGWNPSQAAERLSVARSIRRRAYDTRLVLEKRLLDGLTALATVPLPQMQDAIESVLRQRRRDRLLGPHTWCREATGLVLGPDLLTAGVALDAMTDLNEMVTDWRERYDHELDRLLRQLEREMMQPNLTGQWPMYAFIDPAREEVAEGEDRGVTVRVTGMAEKNVALMRRAIEVRRFQLASIDLLCEQLERRDRIRMRLQLEPAFHPYLSPAQPLLDRISRSLELASRLDEPAAREALRVAEDAVQQWHETSTILSRQHEAVWLAYSGSHGERLLDQVYGTVRTEQPFEAERSAMAERVAAAIMAMEALSARFHQQIEDLQ
ncbi:MAG: hypothetical protein ACR2GY_06030 [Phycisphaerales bacterium]